MPVDNNQHQSVDCYWKIDDQSITVVTLAQSKKFPVGNLHTNKKCFFFIKNQIYMQKKEKGKEKRKEERKKEKSWSRRELNLSGNL